MKDKIVYTFYKDGEVVTELRRTGKYLGKSIFPGGNIDPTDPTIYAALFREVFEETGTKITGFYKGKSIEVPEKDICLHPFLIVGWLGSIPKDVLDNGNPLEWKELDQMRSDPIDEVASLANLFHTIVTQLHT